MPGVGVPHTRGLSQLVDGTISIGDTFRAMLILDSYTPNPDSNFVSDIVASEITEVYTRPTLASVAVTFEAGKVKIDAADVTTGLLLGDQELVGYIAIYKVNTADSDHVLMASLQGAPKFTGDEAGADEQFNIIFDSLGWMNLITTAA